MAPSAGALCMFPGQPWPDVASGRDAPDMRPEQKVFRRVATADISREAMIAQDERAMPLLLHARAAAFSAVDDMLRSRKDFDIRACAHADARRRHHARPRHARAAGAKAPPAMSYDDVAVRRLRCRRAEEGRSARCID